MQELDQFWWQILVQVEKHGLQKEEVGGYKTSISNANRSRFEKMIKGLQALH